MSSIVWTGGSATIICNRLQRLPTAKEQVKRTSAGHGAGAFSRVAVVTCAPSIYLVYILGMLTLSGAHRERPPRPPRAAQRGTEVRPAAAERVRVADGRGVAAQRRAGVHDAAASRAGRVRRDRRGEANGRRSDTASRPPARASSTSGSTRRPISFPPTRRTRDQGARGPAGPGHRRPRDPAVAPPAGDRGHAALHPGQGRCREDDVPLALVADAELFRLEAIVRWLDAADVRLKRLPPPNVPAAECPEPTRATEVSQ